MPTTGAAGQVRAPDDGLARFFLLPSRMLGLMDRRLQDGDFCARHSGQPGSFCHAVIRLSTSPFRAPVPQVLFNTRVAETLAKAGHDVTMIMISAYDEKSSNPVKTAKEVKSESDLPVGIDSAAATVPFPFFSARRKH